MRIFILVFLLASMAFAGEAPDNRPIKELAAERVKIQAEMKAILEELQKKQVRFNELTNQIADRATKDAK